MDNFLLIPFIGVFCGISGSLFVFWLGPRIHLMDKPLQRSSHLVPVARGAGIGFVMVFCLLSFIFLKEYRFGILAGILGLFSFLTDRFEITSQNRLIFHLCVAILFIAFFLHLPFSLIGVLLFFFWAVFIAGTANFYNFMDGINGIAALTGIVAFSFMAFYASRYAYNIPVYVLSTGIIFACLGFLPFNIIRPKVFMGDVGSITLGFVYAAQTALLAKNFLDFVCLFSFLFPFYADELVTMWVRLKGRQDLTVAHRRHIYQFLANELKIPHWRVAIFYVFIQICAGTTVLFFRPFGVIILLFILCVFFMGVLAIDPKIRAFAGRINHCNRL